MRRHAAGCTAHPRWRGEDVAVKPAHHGYLGSSPLARGGLGAPQGMVGEIRLIPAGAGRTQSRRRTGARRAAHPRWRGEDPAEEAPVTQADGSSPLARGGLVELGVYGLHQGLIPAGAGRTVRGNGPVGRHPAHPRWRGEDHNPERRFICRYGSSPLARGGQVRYRCAPGRHRLIPAGAGRTVN